MFRKILIANRGEIACRIIRTARRLGIKTVAVFSEADRRSPHVNMADEAYLLGPSPAHQSYLNAQKILEIALQSKAEAIHPGYGFLSENADFAQLVLDAGLTFIGPSPDVIRIMGDKLEAKSLALRTGVSLVPGSTSPVISPEEILTLAQIHGYPILLKAAAGGGGKGMRVVYQETDIQEFFSRAVSEATSSFGDGRIFVEKYIENPRHIEIQILADQHEHVIHLGERECTLQRRHQKVVEECPSTFVTPELRQKMTHQAIALAKGVGYTSAGTVEFIVAPDKSFYFLEMNTRLQVEHPTTEMVTNIDIVEEMIRIAANEPLRYKQSDITFTGHAIECRLYAEDPSRTFLPSSGHLTFYRPPPLTSHVRLDDGVCEGSDVSIYYDPMLGKLITWGKNRDEALLHAQNALSQFEIKGIDHNGNFLQQLLRDPNVQQNQVSTHFIESEFPLTQSGFERFLALNREEQHFFVSVIAHLAVHFPHILQSEKNEYTIVIQDKVWIVSLRERTALSADWACSLTLDYSPGENHFHVTSTIFSLFGQVESDPIGLSVTLFGISLPVRILPQHIWQMSQFIPVQKQQSDTQTLKSPMPGTLISLPISVGDHVKIGQTLAIIEAMKMENVLKSPVDATVQDIYVSNGDNLTRNQIIARFA